eukprot:1296223-Rhodomonas_salina.2
MHLRSEGGCFRISDQDAWERRTLDEYRASRSGRVGGYAKVESTGTMMTYADRLFQAEYWTSHRQAEE